MAGGLNRVVLAVTVSAGFIIGATGMFFYNKFAERRRQRYLNRLELSMNEMREELRLLRQQAHNSKKISETSMVVSDTDDEDVFYDISDDEVEDDNDLNLEDGLHKASELLKQGPEEISTGYILLLKLSEKYPHNADVFWHLAKACHILASTVFCNDIKSKKSHIEEGIKFAEFSIQLDNCNAESHKWLAILFGSRADCSKVPDNVKDGILFKKQLDTALSINPDDYVLHHLLGRFKFEVASLSWVARNMVRTIFSDFPYATYSDALLNFLKAEELNVKPWKTNKLYVAKCYQCMKNDALFNNWLQEAAEAPIESAEDKTAHIEIEDLLSKY